MGLDLQGQVGIVTTQRPAPKELTRFDVLMCEQSEGWKEKFFTKFKTYLKGKAFQKITLPVQNSNTHYVRFKKRGEESQFTYKIKSKKKSRSY